MAKTEKMTRGVSSKAQRGGGTEIHLPPGVHSIDSHGNIFASLPEIARVVPKFFTFEQIKTAFEAGRLETLSDDDIKALEGLVSRK